MAGFVGIVSNASPESCQIRLAQMLSALPDESFYRTGTYCDKDLGLYLGWRCHIGAFNDCLPIQNERADLAMVLAGEIFSQTGEIGYLKGGGHSFTPDNASYLVHIYEERGIAFIEGLNGRFCGILADRNSRSCFLFNDRFGLSRVFYHSSKSELVFATQANPLLSLLPLTRDFDSRGLGEFLICGCTLGENSLFKDIQILPSASIWTIDFGRCVGKKTYFVPRAWESQDRLGLAAYSRDVLDVIPEVIRRYGDSDGPLGLSLTGGLDTRVVTACLDMPPGRYPCYTFGSRYRETFDVKIARQVARACRQSHSTIVLDKDFIDRFPEGVEQSVLNSSGYLSLFGAASLHVNSRARDISSIRLTGNYGSELLRGVRTFKSERPKFRFYDPSLQPYMEEGESRFDLLGASDPITFSLFHQAPSHGFGLLAVEDSQVVMRTPFLDNQLAELIYRGPRSYSVGVEISMAIISRYHPALLDISTDFGYLGRERGWTKKARRAYLQSLFKAEYLSGRGMPQWATKLLYFLPWLSPQKLFLGRHKYQHFEFWLRHELSEYIKDALVNDSQCPSCLDKIALNEMVSMHLSGKANFLYEIDRALTIHLGAKYLFYP